MKRILALFLAAGLVLSCAACKREDEKSGRNFEIEKIEIVQNGIIPKGGIYYTNVPSEYLDYGPAHLDRLEKEKSVIKMEEGEAFPAQSHFADIYVYGDYVYSMRGMDAQSKEEAEEYFKGLIMRESEMNDFDKIIKAFDSINVSEKKFWEQWFNKAGIYTFPCKASWSVHINKEKYKNWMDVKYFQPILQSINEKPVAIMDGVFSGCTELVMAPEIPTTITSMEGAFWGCENLITYTNSKDKDGAFLNYKIPKDMENMISAFELCKNIKSAPVIPQNVKYIDTAFRGCKNLAGTVTINAENLKSWLSVFGQTTETIYLTGDCSKIKDIASSSYLDNVFAS